MSQKVNLFLGQVPFTTRVFLCCCSGGAIKTFFVYSKLSSWILAPSNDIIGALAFAWWCTAFICQWIFGGLYFLSQAWKSKTNSRMSYLFLWQAPWLTLPSHWLSEAFKILSAALFLGPIQKYKILYHYFENEKALIKLFIILPVWSCQHSVGKNHYKVSSYLILTAQWLALQTSHCAWWAH